MTAPATTSQPPWKIRWAAYALTVLALLVFPGQVKAVGSTLLTNVGNILGVDDTTPINVSPTNPPGDQ